MRYILFVLLVAVAGINHTQGQRLVGFAVSFEHDTTLLYNSVSLSDNWVNSYDVNNKGQSIKQKGLREMYVGGDHYINSDNYDMSVDRLQRIVLMNDKYLLTSYFASIKFVFYVYDRRTKERIVKEQKYNVSPKKDQKLLDEHILPYFHDCPDGINAIRNGIGKEKSYDFSHGPQDYMFSNLSNQDCSSFKQGGD